jgi:hypothetical protein
MGHTAVVTGLTGDAYSLTPDPTSGFSNGPWLLNFLDLYFMQDSLAYKFALYCFFHSDGENNDS